MTEQPPITVSLAWAKKLDECGFRGPSYWLWAYHCFDYPDDSEFQKPRLISRDMEDHYHQWETYLAPTWADIYREIPDIKGYEVTLDAEFWNSWNPAVFKLEQYAPFQSRRADAFKPKETSPHDDAAALYCFLTENKLLPTR